MRTHERVRRRLLTVTAATIAVMLASTGAPAMATDAHSPIEGTGSSWSANAVTQWIADVTPQGLQVTFTSTGSAQGRKDYALGNVDFAVTDIAYQGTDAATGDVDASNRKYAYLPIVAGGTSFPYHLTVAGKRVTQLRLSGQTLSNIFTNHIKNWNDPAITADNNGHAFPSIPIIPVVHSEGSGSSAQFTAYMAKEYGSIWGPYNKNKNVMEEYYPVKGDQMVAQNGSDGVMNFINSGSANGSIGYDEYSYALLSHSPVAKIENKAGYFTLPTQYNVAKSLTQAVIDNNPASPTYLIQNLDNVYVYSDPRTYPLSSYSYMILPTASNDPRMKTPKRQTLADFLYYSICTGQGEMGKVGYSPLPINLVQDGFAQIQKLKTADPGVNITQRNVSTCNNPTFVAGHPDENRLAQIAPFPQACDQSGHGPCTTDVPPKPNTSGDGGSGGGSGGGASGGSGGGGGAAGGGAGGAGGTAPPGATPSTSASTVIDPNTGLAVTSGNSDGSAASGGDANPVPTNLADQTGGLNDVLTPLVILELLAVLVAPVLLQRALSRRGRR